MLVGAHEGRWERGCTCTARKHVGAFALGVHQRVVVELSCRAACHLTAANCTICICTLLDVWQSGPTILAVTGRIGGQATSIRLSRSHSLSRGALARTWPVYVLQHAIMLSLLMMLSIMLLLPQLVQIVIVLP